jgi:hypothetical protein
MSKDVNRLNPCATCPWRDKASTYWLGFESNVVVQMVQDLKSGQFHKCHSSAMKNGVENAGLCAGAILVYNSSNKYSKKNKNCFGHYEDFYKYYIE